ncbi:MAG: VIT and VWA domain-containing protein [Deltaproteobacteria bacterium]|nr:VIT and VWA domain-containing protein [Deltaproteobacteria bacterium]
MAAAYAAMDEVPVRGGELRLAVEFEAEVNVGGDTADVIAFPLRHTDVHAQVAGPMALYTIEQTFENPFDQPIEAVYVFPLGDEAAVSGYQITIGDRTIVGDIAEREAARRVYAEAKAAGHTAALLEQDKANVFAQRIANIAPHETVVVRLSYSELLAYQDGRYELAVPLVVGPRYLPGDRNGRRPVGSRHVMMPGPGDHTSVPYADAVVAGSTVSFSADIEAGVPVGQVESPSHDLVVETVSPTRTRVHLREAGEVPNRDLVVRYQTAGERTLVGLLADRRGNDGYFTLAIQPKATYREGDIAGRELVLLIDTSGSMDGPPLRQAKDVAHALIASAGPRDSLVVLGFASGVTPLADHPLVADEDGKARARAFVESLSSGGGTEMEQGMLASLSGDPGADRVRMVYLLSDGFVGNDDVIVTSAKGALGKNRIFPVGIGTAPNRALLDQLGRVGRGFASYVNLSEKAGPIAKDLARRSANPYLTDVAIDWGGLAVADLTPATIPDVYAGQPLVITGRYLRPGAATVTVSANTAGRRVEIPVTVALPAAAELEPVAQTWARHRMDDILETAGTDGLTDDAKAAVTSLGLKFHLVSEFTSFVAVDRTRVVAPGGDTRVVEQPAAIPEGVNLDTAVAPEADTSTSYASGGGSTSSSDYSSGGGGGGGGWGGGGDVDPLTILLALLMAPLAWGLRRARRA